MNRGMSNVIDKIRSNRDVLGWIAGIVLGTVAVLGWMSTNFITTAKGEEMMANAQDADAVLAKEVKDLAESVKASNQMLSVHLAQGELNDVMDRIDNNKTQQFNISQFTRVNGMDSQSEVRLERLKNELVELEIKRGCIIDNNPLCD